ncbi:DNA-3-methyladenine glycosylase family protein [Peribacillus deserti]|uniref:DNA-3-methyladenine glycosylase II n=1 Tax=Peribacillus deserti TaxID=673318 RepID=A0A2N5MBZ7_9BACI|nr:DNA-3-methyladenine glycosylase [Peribacillus deserti]PLT31899.1 DNA-3-methyladenine glycosylase [Peribacillus deserti]
MWTESIDVAGPYNFDLVLDRLSNDPLNSVDFDKRSIKVPIYSRTVPMVILVEALGSTDAPSFRLSGSFEEHKEAAVDRIMTIFQWHLPLEHIHTHFETTTLKDIFLEHRGTPLILDFNPYGCLVKCIVHQQLNLSFAYTLTARYVRTFGFEMEGAWFYPPPEKAASITVEQLRELQFSTRKAEYLIGLSQLIVNKELDIEDLSRQSDEVIIDTLIKIRGIGRWTAENFLLFGLGRPNLFPMADIGIQNALKKLYKLEQKPTREEMEVFSESWDPYLSYASLYLWRSIEKRSEK